MKIVMTAEFDNIQEARDFLRDRAASGVQFNPQSMTSQPAASPAEMAAQAEAANAAAIRAVGTGPALTPAVIQQPSQQVLPETAPQAAGASLRDQAREAMKEFANRGHDVTQVTALIQKVAGVNGLRHATDDKLPALLEAFKAA